MSQSSISSCKSSLESRKRARTSSPETPARKSQRKRFILSLPKKYLEISSQSSSESFNKCDTQSTTSLSITAGAPSEAPTETSSSTLEYASLATQYGLSIDCVKQHYSILTSTAQVLVIKTALIKQEIVSPEKALQTSPVFRSKKRGRKPKIKIEPKSEEKLDSPREGILSKRASRNIHNYFESFSSTLGIKQEPKSDDSLEEFEEKKILQNRSQPSKHQDFMQNGSLSRLRSKSSSQLSQLSSSTSQRFSQSHSCSQQSIQSRSSSLRSSNRRLNPLNSRVSKKLTPVEKWTELIDSSGDEFADLRPKKKALNKTAIQTTQEKIETLVSNPFSKIKKQNSQKSKTKSNSFWRKKFGSDDDPATRKRKFLKSFKLKKGDKSDHVNKDLLDSVSKVEVEKEDSEEERKADKTLTCNRMIKKKRISEKNNTTIKNDSNNIELSTQSSVDSLSVNCQYFNSKTVETVTAMPSQSYPYSPVLSFGADPSDYEPDNETRTNEKICDSNDKLSQDYVNSAVDHDNSNCDNNLEEEENNLNDSFLSLDLMESSTKSIDVELSVKPLKEQKGSIQEKNTHTVKKPRAKPKIISDSKLLKNTIIISDPKKIGIRKQLRANSKAISPNSNEQSLSVTSPLKVLNGTDKQTNDVPPSGSKPKFNGITKNLPLDHVTQQQKQQQQNQQSNSLRNNVGVEESFDSLCEDITELTNYDGQAETITLYKGNNQDDADVEVLSLSAGNSPNSEHFKTPTCTFLNSDTKEKSSSSSIISKTRKSPINFQRDSRLSLSSPTVIKTRRNTTPNDTKKKSLLDPNTATNKKSPITFQRSSRLSLLSSKSGFSNVNGSREDESSNGTNDKSSPSASNSTSRKSPITFKPTSRLSLSLKSSVITKAQECITSDKLNNRLQQQNLSSSVNSLSKTQQQQPTASESTSSFQTSSTFVNKDPRLNRSISPIKSTNVVSRDPRLNRLISPTKLPALTDPRFVRSNSRPSSPTTSVVSTYESPDPRLQKRAERENTETIIQQRQEINLVKQENHSSITIRDSQSAQKKASVFERLGRKSPSPNKHIDVKKELMDIVKSGKVRSIGYYDSDDEECISIHPGDMFSSDEESNASPPHRKFTSERMRQNEEIRNKPMSIKDRLTLNNSRINQRNPSSFVTPAVPTTTATTTRTTRLINRITFDINADNQSQVSTVSATTMQPFMQTVPKVSGMAAYASQCRKEPFNTYSNNDAAFNTNFYKDNSAALNDKFYKMNAAQMRKDVDNLSQFGSSPTITFDNNTQQTHDTDSMFTADTVKILFFKRFCFRMLRYGNCSMEMTSCHYSHHVYSLQKLIKEKKLEVLMPILDCAIHQKFNFFLQNVWSSLLPKLNDEMFNVYNKLYQAELRSERFLNELLDYCLNSKLYTVESFVKKLAMFVEKGNRDWVRNICVAIKPKISDGFCWETIKCLAQKAVPPVDMIELTILQCLKRKKNSSHINEVYNLIKNKITNLERSRMSQTMLKQFYTLVQKTCLVNEKEVLNTIPLASSSNDVTEIAVSSPAISRCQSVESLKSAEVENQGLTVNTSCNVQQPINSPVDVLKNTPSRGESTNFSEYTVNEVDSGEPTSVFRDRFWKIYLRASVIDKCLAHEDYDDVWNTLNEFCKENVQDTLLKRAYYHILCKNVKTCQRHISEIIKRAVRNRWPSSQKCIDLLFDVGIYALIDLGNNDLWVMALDLLSSLKIIEPNEPRTTFVLICTEIYLANSDPLEALYLLQRTRLIKTNRDEWLTKDHTKDDEKHRNKVVIILLKALSYNEPEKAVYLFKELLTDQYIYYYPIDLRLYLDKLMLLLLLNGKDELVADMCRLIIGNDLTLQKSTYRELITRMLPIDEVLTNQVLDYAIHLGYYNDIQIKNGFTTVIIDTNSSEEELYLILRRLIYILKLNVGPVIHRLRPNQLKVTLIFEDIPVEKRLYINEVAAKRSDTYISIRNLVNKMLATRFTPPIRISRGKVSKICKLMSRTLVDYLKHWD
ncbi:hypothetical protein TSAR_005223 [Trichomalopsis sarcophagae]|uniref:Uncharacterized protein n=1 Tax=Trichomalopsis sarcophagae TaxID=543379 RepID=A0A232ET85_9HYME|nr:hypothetical protein TSAR_005223 [Trichomalopsis sarcophagae]